MRTLLRQLASEGRKLIHPLPIVAILATTTIICLLQWAHRASPYPGPSITDLTGCVRIASLQYGTTLGFVLAGVVAAMNTAEELSTGSINDALLREPRRQRLAVLKISVVFGVLVIAWAIAIASLWLTSWLLRAHGTDFARISRSSVAAMCIDASASLLAMAFAAVLGVTVAMLTRSQVVSIILTPALFAIPLTILSDRIFWAWPTRWIVEWLHLDPFGNGVDYLADISPYDYRGTPAVAGGLALAFSALVLIAFSGRLLDRASLLTGERV
jgi:hypothetical protein